MQWLKPPWASWMWSWPSWLRSRPVPGHVLWWPLPAWPLRTKPALCLPVAVLTWVPPLLQARSVSQSHLTLGDPMDCSLPDSSLHRIFQARILEWMAISSSKGSSRPRDGTHISGISCIGRWSLYHWATWEAPTSLPQEQKYHHLWNWFDNVPRRLPGASHSVFGLCFIPHAVPSVAVGIEKSSLKPWSWWRYIGVTHRKRALSPGVFELLTQSVLP